MKCIFCFLLVIVATIAGVEISHANSVILDWTASVAPHIAGYNVYFGTSPGNFPYKLSVGNVTTITISGLTAGITYYFVATTRDGSGHESGDSSVAQFLVPAELTTARPVSTPRIKSVKPFTPLEPESPVKVCQAPRATVDKPFQPAPTLAAKTFRLAVVKTQQTLQRESATANLYAKLFAKPSRPALLQFPVKSGYRYQVQASSNLRAWISLGESCLAVSNGWMQFTDPDSKLFSSRFYRLIAH